MLQGILSTTKSPQKLVHNYPSVSCFTLAPGDLWRDCASVLHRGELLGNNTLWPSVPPGPSSPHFTLPPGCPRITSQINFFPLVLSWCVWGGTGIKSHLYPSEGSLSTPFVCLSNVSISAPPLSIYHKDFSQNIFLFLFLCF